MFPSISIEEKKKEYAGKGRRRAEAIYKGQNPPITRPIPQSRYPIQVAQAAVDSDMQPHTVSSEGGALDHYPHHPDAVYNDQVASFFLSTMAKPFPDYETLAHFTKPNPSKEEIRSRLSTLQKDRNEQLEALYNFQSTQTAKLFEDQALQTDFEYKIQDSESLMKWFRKQDDQLSRRQNDTWMHLREAQRIAELPVYQQLVDFDRDEQKRREILNTTLPTKREDFERMDEGPKYKVARWLHLSRPVHLRQPKWTNEAQNSLWDVYSKDDHFKAIVSNIVESKRSMDPRRK